MDLGVWNRLRIDRFTSIGAYLVDQQGNDVLLPGKLLLEDWSVGDTVEVFLYKDSEDRLIATTMEPYIQLGQFGYLEVTDVNPFGAFLDWGIEKDLLVPFREQPKDMVEGRFYLVYLYLDEATQRLAATARVEPFLQLADEHIKKQDKVVILVCERTDLGFKVIVENKYRGLIFNSDIHRNLRSGDIVDGFVKNIRPDGKLDISLHEEGYAKVDPLAQELLDLLQKNEGFLPLTDKSDPEDVQRITGWSKKTFKQVVGNLYKQRRIVLGENGIALS